MSADKYEEVLERALNHARDKFKGFHPFRHAAFANGVAYLVTGWSGGYGGPSVREHAVSYAGHDAGIVGAYDVEEAMKIAEPVVFGPLGDAHRLAWRQEYCFQDDPEDLRILQAS